MQFVEWSGTTGSESGEWLGATAALRAQNEPAVQLHTTQEIAGTVTAGNEKPTEGTAQAHFHSESLSTLALEDLRLLGATRSRARDCVDSGGCGRVGETAAISRTPSGGNPYHRLR